MKFTNGFWSIRDNIEPHFAACAIEPEIRDNELVVYAPERWIRHRGDTLNAQLLTIRYSSPIENVIKVRVSHFEGIEDKGPHFETHGTCEPGGASKVKTNVRITDGKAVLESGKLSVSVEINSWNNCFYGDGKLLTKNLYKSTGYMLEKGCCCCEEKTPYMKDELSLTVGELVYGLGERFGPFVKNGQSVDIWNADGGSASEQAYKNVPFYMTNKGYGVFVNDPGNVSFEISSEKTARVQFCVKGEAIEYFVIYGPTPKEILERYTTLTGKPAMPPKWSFGLWLSTSFTTSYDEKTVMSFIDGMEERKIPLSVFHFDCFWMRGFNWCDFTWDKETFPDPKGMLSRIKAKGIKICVWINPYIAQRSALFAEGKKGGYFIKKPDGSVFQTDAWQAGMAIVDFTNPAAVKWYCGCLEKLLDMGVDCFKTDFGEKIPEDVTYFDGGDPHRHHNFYSFLYNKAVFELLERKRGKGEAVLFARSATAGGQRFPLHWGGDCESTFEAMAETLRGGLSLGLCGFGFWSHDIGGFEGTPNAALFKRWLAFGLLSSHSRLHGSTSYRVPWSVDEESADVCRFFTELKTKLLPDILKAAQEACEKGIPVLRAMIIEFPGDPACEYLDRQYMLGSNLLVAPVFSESGEVTYYLPEGEWTQVITGETVTVGGANRGGCWKTEKHGFLSIPIWKR
uniref:alpha-D-xyloside xylohydrolase n=1 Tax=uncultured bacterium contig00004 TaxID=1181496 RepID=A0A806KAA6_9BACT|nr:alpha-xylosidase [uncultured bacterium contig00004]